MPQKAVGYASAYSNVEDFARLQKVTAVKMSREELISSKADALSIVFLYPPLLAKENEAAKEEYETVTKPRQQEFIEALRERGMMNCAYANGAVNGVGLGIKVIA